LILIQIPIYDSARKAIASITKKVTKKATSKKKSKDVGTSKRHRKDDTFEEEQEEPDNPNDSDFDPADESVSASFMVEERGDQSRGR
jgi:ribosomal protein S2